MARSRTRLAWEELALRELLKPRVDLDQYPKQAEWIRSKEKYRLLRGGYGSGKTWAGAYEALRAAIECPGSVGWCVAPTDTHLRSYTLTTLFGKMLAFPDGRECTQYNAEDHPLVSRWLRSSGRLELTLVNGSVIHFKPAHGLIGASIDWFWLDEPSDCEGHIFEDLQGRLRGHIGLPLRGWLTGTPNGFDWVYNTFDARGRYVMQISSHDNPHTPEEFKLDLDTSYRGSTRKAKVYGDVVAMETAVFGTFSKSHHVLPEDWYPESESTFYIVADFGVDGPTVWLWAIDSPQGIFFFDELGVAHQPVKVIADEVKLRNLALAVEGYTLGNAYGDVAGKQRGPDLESYVTLYAKEGIDIQVRSAGRIKTGCDVIASELGDPREGDVPRLFIHPRCVNLIQAFLAYHYPEDKAGNPLGDTPDKDGVNDHFVDPCRYLMANRYPEKFRRTTAERASTGGTRKTARGQEPVSFPLAGKAGRSRPEDRKRHR